MLDQEEGGIEEIGQKGDSSGTQVVPDRESKEQVVAFNPHKHFLAEIDGPATKASDGASAEPKPGKEEDKK